MPPCGFAAPNEPKPVRVALFADAKSTDERSREAAWRVLSAAPGLRVEKVTTPTVLGDGLDAFDVLVFPGGTGNGLARALGVAGGKRVERYASEGHGVIGICAGGYLIVEGWNAETKAIQLLNAKSWDDDHWARGEQFIAVKVVGAKDGESSRTIWFENGPIFVPGALSGVPAYTPLVRYETDLAAKDAPKGMMTGRDAIVAAPFGKGRVVGFGPHSELTPDLNHWLVNAVRWAAGRTAPGEPPTASAVLDGKSDAKPAGR